MKKNEKAKTRNITAWAIIYFIALFILMLKNPFGQNIEKKAW